MRASILALVFVLSFAVSCNGDEDDAPPADAMSVDTPDAPAPDGPAADPCQTLCACTEEFCSQEMTACLTECAGLSASARACRIEHCGYAMTDAAFHCPHARGEELCD